MKELQLALPGSFAWQYTELPEIVNGFVLPEAFKARTRSDFNMGIDKSHRVEFLKKLEFLTRKEVNAYLKIPLEKVPEDAPHHLDNRKEFKNYGKHSFSNLIIKRIAKGKEIGIENNDLVLSFGQAEIFEFFTLMYVNFELYATEEDIVIDMYYPKHSKMLRLVIWGVYQGLPVYY